MRKLCYFINSDWYFDLHWIDRAIASRDAGYEIHIISHFIDDNIINKFKTFGFICHNVTLDAQSFNALVFFRTYHDVQKIIKNIKPDVLITEGFFQWTPLLVLYSFIHRTPIFMGYERTCHTERNTKWIMNLYRKIINLFVTGYLVNGNETKRYLLQLGIKEENIFITGMSADSTLLKAGIASMTDDEKESLNCKFGKCIKRYY